MQPQSTKYKYIYLHYKRNNLMSLSIHKIDLITIRRKAKHYL